MDDAKALQHIERLLLPALAALDNTVKRLDAVEQRLQDALSARLIVVDQLLAERHAEEAFVASREAFRERHLGIFDDARWGTEPEWLIALRHREA